MEVEKRGFSQRLKWISNIIKHGLFWHGVRNNFAKIGIDIMPYYIFKAVKDTDDSPKIKGDDQNFEISIFGEGEVSQIKNTIIGIEGKDLMQDLRNGDTCIGVKHKNEIAVYTFARHKSFYFRKRFFDLGKEDCYLHSIYTFENYRGKNLAPYLRYQIYRVLEKKGIKNYYSISEYFNASAIKYQQKVKSKRIKLCLSIVLFNRWTRNFTLKSY